MLNFQDPRFVNDSSSMPLNSYIWDVNNPNKPDLTLTPASPLLCLRHNPKAHDQLIGGCYNGLVTVFDRRVSAPSKPVETSVIENSHHDPVYDAYWINSKTGNMAASCSTDGQMLWWDIRRLGEPTDRLQLKTSSRDDGVVLGGRSLEYVGVALLR